MLISATLDHPSKKIASSYMNHPVDVAVKPEQVTAEGIDQMVYHVAKDKKFRLLLGILSREEVTKGLIFANMKITVTWLARKLKDNGYQVEMLTGDMAQQARNRVLDRFKRGSVPLLVASDVASRGLHIEDVTHIINYDVPQDPEDYVHRIGRTARAGKRGKAYSLACDDCCWYLPAIEDLIGAPLPNAVPQDEDFGEDRSPSFTVRRMLALERQGRRDADRSEQARRQSRPAARRSSTVGKGPSERRDAPPPRSNRRQPSRQRKKEPGAAPTS
jgi:ATP-dependent RNA helicase RhlB